MSWDIFVQDIPSDARTVDDIPDDFVPATIGRRSELIEKIKEVVPFADFSDPAWGTIEGADYSIEVNLGANESIDSFAFHVRGDDVAAGLISDLLTQMNLRAFDGGTGDIFDHERAAAGLKKWRTYRDLVVDCKSAANEEDK